MGLDMYLTKETYVKNWDWFKPEERWQITVHKGEVEEKNIKPSRISDITEQMGYWRKANAIHKWFVDNVQDGVDECQKSWVSMDQLKQLLNVVQTVLDNHDKATELLPVQKGFFFGGTDYDEYYFQDLEDTKKIIETIVEEDPEGKGSYYYQSSW
jgi:hypothetical protein